MSERIVSPGVFTREKDLSFLPQGIAEIGAAIIGPTLKGPAFVPTQVTSFAQFENIFGDATLDKKKNVKRIGVFKESEIVGMGSLHIERVVIGAQGSIGKTEAQID